MFLSGLVSFLPLLASSSVVHAVRFFFREVDLQVPELLFCFTPFQVTKLNLEIVRALARGTHLKFS